MSIANMRNNSIVYLLIRIVDDYSPLPLKSIGWLFVMYIIHLITGENYLLLSILMVTILMTNASCILHGRLFLLNISSKTNTIQLVICLGVSIVLNSLLCRISDYKYVLGLLFIDFLFLLMIYILKKIGLY